MFSSDHVTQRSHLKSVCSFCVLYLLRMSQSVIFYFKSSSLILLVALKSLQDTWSTFLELVNLPVWRCVGYFLESKQLCWVCRPSSRVVCTVELQLHLIWFWSLYPFLCLIWSNKHGNGVFTLWFIPLPESVLTVLFFFFRFSDIRLDDDSGIPTQEFLDSCYAIVPVLGRP